ncbi:MAG: PfkB family carbohydrate kinase [Planctomycetota bacterium]
MSLVVVGSVAFDSIVTPTARRADVLGGSAVHFSMSSSFHTETHLVGVVGEDFPADRRQVLQDRGIRTDGLETVAGGKTFRWEGKYHDDMNQRETLMVELNVFERFQPVLSPSHRRAKFLFLANAAPLTQARVLDQVEPGAFVMADTMNLWVQTAHSDLEALIPRIDGLVLNDEEASLLSEDDRVIPAGRMIREKYGLRYLVIKKGEHGSMIFHDDGEVALPAFPIASVTDPTGAGDSFAGGLMGYLASAGRTDLQHFKRGVAWGTIMASFCCEDFGVHRMTRLEPAEMHARFAAFQSMLSLTHG